MRAYLEASWWMILLQGLLLVLLGLFAVVWPGLTLVTFIYGVAAYLVLTGIVNIVLSLGSIGKAPTWFLWMLISALEVGVGVYIFKHIDIGLSLFALLLGLVFVVRGVQQIISSFGDGHENRHRALYAITGVISLIAGIVVWAYPSSSGVAFAWVVGIYGIVAGSMIVAAGLELRPRPHETLIV